MHVTFTAKRNAARYATKTVGSFGLIEHEGTIHSLPNHNQNQSCGLLKLIVSRPQPHTTLTSLTPRPSARLTHKRGMHRPHCLIGVFL